MSGYILCQTKKAEHPYFVESISTNIYTIEETLLLSVHNLYLVDQTTSMKICANGWQRSWNLPSWHQSCAR